MGDSASTAADLAEVRVRFEGSADPARLWAQLERWHISIMGSATDAVVRPSLVRDTDAPEFRFPAPRSIGYAPAGPRVLRDVVERIRRVAVALDSLHASGIVHGALVPASLWWMTDGAVRFPDAALAHSLEGIERPSVDVHLYRAPEVWHGAAPVPASDQYSLAVIAYEMLTGRPRRDQQMVEGIVAVEPMLLEANALVAAGAPVGMADVLQRALSSSPRSRYDRCATFAEALAAQLGVVETRPASTERLSRRHTRNGVIGVFAATLALAMIGLASFTASDRDGARRYLASWRAKVPGLRNSATLATANPTAAQPGVMQRGRTNSAAPGAGTTGAATTTGSSSERPAADPRRPAQQGGASSAPGASSTAGARTTLGVTSAASAAGARSVDSTLRARAAAATAGARGTADRAVAAATERAARTARDLAVPVGGADGGVGESSGRLDPAASSGSAASVPAGAPVRGTLRLTVPNGSRVYIDGVLLAGSARTVEVQAGTHDVDVLTSNGVRHRRRVMVRGGESADVTVKP